MRIPCTNFSPAQYHLFSQGYPIFLPPSLGVEGGERRGGREEESDSGIGSVTEEEGVEEGPQVRRRRLNRH